MWWTRSFLILTTIVMHACAVVPTAYEARLSESKNKVSTGAQTVNVRFVDGSQYKGTVVNGAPDGKGVLTLKNGYTYKGEFKQGKMHGQGVLTGPDERFAGTFANDHLVTGRWANKQGLSVEGEFDENKNADGKLSKRGKLLYQGLLAYSSQSFYKHGNGVSYEANGMRYKGRFNHDKKDGEFITTGRRIEYFEVYNDDKLVWQTLSPAHLSKISGNCNVKSKSGKWVVTKGKCSGGLLEGKGHVTRGDSRAVAFGQFRQGELVDGELLKLSGVSYKGSFAGMTPHGNSVEEFVNSKLVYYGEYRNGIRHGYGVCMDDGKQHCEYIRGRRVDAVFLAKKQLEKLRSIAGQYRQSVDAQLAAEIKQKRRQFEREHRARVKQLENQKDNVTAAHFTTAVLQGMAHNAAGNSAASDAAIREQAEKANEYIKKIEKEKQNHRREMQRKEREWARWKKQEIARQQDGFERHYRSWSAIAKRECNMIEGRNWNRGVCIPDNGLQKSEVYALNRIINEQSRIRAGANNSFASSSGMLDRYVSKSAGKWQRRMSEAAQAETQRQQNASFYSELQSSVNAQVQQAKSEMKRIDDMYKPRPKGKTVSTSAGGKDSGNDEGSSSKTSSNKSVSASAGSSNDDCSNPYWSPPTAHSWCISNVCDFPVDISRESDGSDIKKRDRCMEGCKTGAYNDFMKSKGCNNRYTKPGSGPGSAIAE